MFELIKTLTRQDKKTILERMVKLQEECGELAQEILIHLQTSGSQHKEKGLDGIKGESIDVILVALSIFFDEGGTQEEFDALIKQKSLKWEKLMKKKA